MALARLIRHRAALSRGVRNLASIPVVDVSSWVSGSDSAERREAARALGHAFETTGFAVVRGHGVAPEVVQAMRSQSLDFFTGPAEAKAAVAAKPVHGAQGFHEQGHENVAQLLGDFSRPPDTVERLVFRDLHAHGCPQGQSVYGEGIADDLPKIPAQPGFQSALDTYLSGITEFWQVLTRISESALELPPGYFDAAYGIDTAKTTLQSAHYFSRAECAEGEDEVAFGAHTDSGGLTILTTDAPGLEVRLKDGWQPVPLIEGTFVVNVGRLLSRWTNDRWLASVHRVLKPQGRRLTLAFFTSPAASTNIQCLPSCGPAKYDAIRAGDFMHKRHLLHIPPEQRDEQDKIIAKEFWEAAEPTRA